jgi:hypothetical protein
MTRKPEDNANGGDLHPVLLCLCLPSVLSHRIAPHLDTVRVVDEAVEDAISERGIS